MYGLTKDESERLGAEVGAIRERIAARGDLPYATVARQIELLEELTQFALGCHMLLHRGAIDGYWNYYAIRHNLTPYSNIKPLERFMIEQAPYMKAAFQTFQNIQKISQSQLKEGVTFASIPSGVMADLLTLDYTGLKRFELIGVDIDLMSHHFSLDLADEKNLTGHVHFYERDAWKLGLQQSCDLIVCNGLNCYEPDTVKQFDLYSQLYAALKDGGTLLVSYLTPPPGVFHRTEWALDRMSMEDVLLQKILYFDVLDCCWQVFTPTDQMRQMLLGAGFDSVQIAFDEARLIPLAIAQKKGS